MATQYDNVSSDLLWEIARSNNSFLVKRKQAGGVQFSRDPLNLTNKHSRKYAGFANEKSIGLQPGSENQGVVFTTKKPGKAQTPKNAIRESSFSSTVPTRKMYRSIVNTTAKQGYRPDLRAEAVARASAIRASQREKKEKPAPKPRGKKALRKANASS